jgi:peroxiredoxin Q/BCP
MSHELSLHSPFPPFSLSAAVPQPDGSIDQNTLTLESFAGKPLVLFIYPKDNTSGCIIEVCGFRDMYGQFKEAGIAVVGISRDTVRSHINFIKKQELPYPLLADPEQSTLKEWQLIVNKTMYGKPVTKVLRTTFLIDKTGNLRHIWENVTPLGHAEAVLEHARSMGGID